MDARETRLAKNEVVFREINERVSEIAADHGPDGHLYTFFCECSNADCTLQLELDRGDYERVRAHGERFLVAAGHDLPEIERVLERNEGWWVVEKQQEAGELARDHDPRS